MVKLTLCWFALVSLIGLLVAAVGDKASKNRTTVLALTEDETRYEYVGTKKCRMCHTAQYESWKASPKGNSWQVLQSGEGTDVKRSAGLDPGQDYTTDPRCLACHAVGFGEPGGYVIPDPKDDESGRFATNRQGAGCEACHGPGSGFVEIMRDINRRRRKYDPAELHARGRRVVDRAVCVICHNRRAICMIPVGVDPAGVGGPWLHVDVSDRHGFHKKFPLKLRMRRDTVDAQGGKDAAND